MHCVGSYYTNVLHYLLILSKNSQKGSIFVNIQGGDRKFVCVCVCVCVLKLKRSIQVYSIVLSFRNSKCWIKEIKL